MKIVCISDTHNKHKQLEMPEGDILLHAGDFTSLGHRHEIIAFNNWLGSLDYKHKVVIAGNHDHMFCGDGKLQPRFVMYGVKQDPQEAESLLTNCVYLNQTSVEIEGLKIYGEPRQPWFHSWAFNIDRGKMQRECWDKVPADIDILLTHGPPLGAGDRVTYPPGERVGCQKQREMIYDHKTLKLVVCGHIHEDYGVYDINGKTIVNASNCTLQYDPINPPVVIEL